VKEVYKIDKTTQQESPVTRKEKKINRESTVPSLTYSFALKLKYFYSTRSRSQFPRTRGKEDKEKNTSCVLNWNLHQS